ncbi:MAG: hypothetical protein H6832_16975 [Planctomycetes bacterium]|nr:hypothetical protein [Planctomycetota bacterium]MCB9890681.1 hypothetical protein [Planctomycetota bacterium]MCB9920096.1 hypothetical protein [Planctomycetota bacterium]
MQVRSGLRSALNDVTTRVTRKSLTLSLCGLGLITAPVLAQGNADAKAADTDDSGAKSERNAQDAATSREAALATFLERIEVPSKTAPTMRILLSFRGSIPDPKGGKPLTMKALLRLESLEETVEGTTQRWSRLDVDLTTPQGMLRTEKVRSPEGIRIHQASELTGEKWLEIDRATVARLDKAARVLGAQGALPIEGPATPSAVVGADLVRGLARSYELVPGAETEIDGEVCYSLAGKLRGQGDESRIDLPRERADEVQLFYSKKTRLLVRMLQFQRGNELYAIYVRDAEFGAPLQKSRFALTPPKGVRFVDLFDDELASLSVRLELERLDEWERKQKPESGSTEPDKK